MHACVTSFQVKLGSGDAVADRMAQVTAAMIAGEQLGLRARYGFLDRSTGDAMRISMWETATNLESDEIRGASQPTLCALIPHLVGCNIRDIFDVVADQPSP